MRELLEEIDKFIRFIAYDKDACFDGELITDELREYLVETFEMTKKSLYLILHKKRYDTKKYCINQNDMFYKINQILYYLDTYHNLYLDEDYLNDIARKSLKSNLEKILQAVKVDNTLTIDRDILATIQ